MRKLYTPRAYQGPVTDFILEHPRCFVMAGMGLGKTVAAETALDITINLGTGDPALVIAPLRVARKTWGDEAAKWEHLRCLNISPVVGNENDRKRALRRPAQVYTVNYENLPWLMLHVGKKWPFKHVIADESTKLKGFRLKQGGFRARVLGQIAHTPAVEMWTNLTGTPAPNGLQDLWGQAWYLDEGERLGRSYEAFKQRWFQRSLDGYNLEPLPFAHEQITDKLRDISISVDAKDYFDLKEPIVNNIYVQMPTKVRALYKQMEREMFMEIEQHPVEAFNAAARTQKLLQLCNGAVYVDPLTDTDDHPRARQWKMVHEAKLEALEDVFEEAAGMPVLVAYHFKSDLTRLLKAFPKGRHIHSAKDEDDWNAGKIPYGFMHPASGGHGINLQDGGNIIVHFGQDWNLEQYMQINERLGPVRQMQAGHDRPVFHHHIIMEDTVDELVMARRESKRSVQDLLLSEMKRRV